MPFTRYKIGFEIMARGILLVLVSLLQASFSANIGFYGGPGVGSHFAAEASLGEALVRRGHNVTAIISGVYVDTSIDARYAQLFDFAISNERATPEESQRRQDRFNKAAVSGNFFGELMKDMDEMRAENLADCDAMVNDDAFIARLKSARLDMLIMDPWFGCVLALPEILDTRVIIMLPTPLEEHVASAFGSPVNIALHPAQGTGFPQIMTFWQRLRNFVQVQIIPSMMFFLMKGADDYRKLRNIFPETSTQEVIAGAELLFINMDFAVEFPIPLAPNVITVGGIMNREPTPLPQDLEDFMHSSGDHGIIVFSLGTHVTFLKQEVIDHFREAFSRFPQKVVWKYNGAQDLKNTSQTMILPWIPQNDLVAHTKTRLLVFQGGNNGFYEAIDHGTPMVAIPLLVDQFDVAARVKHHDIGLELDFQSLNSDKIADAIKAIIDNKRYKENAERLSTIYHDRNPVRPVEKAAFWVEHVIKHGASHLKSPIHELAWYQYHLIDVCLAIFICIITILLILYYFLKLIKTFICYLCCGGSSKQKCE